MTFDLILSKGFKTAVIVTVMCKVTEKQGARKRKGLWAIKKEHQHLFRLVAKVPSGIMYSFYGSNNVPYVWCYNDTSPHNPASGSKDPELAFGCQPAPLDESGTYKHLTKGDLKIFQPANVTMENFEGKWIRWI
jgi:hypothetical protein